MYETGGSKVKGAKTLPPFPVMSVMNATTVITNSREAREPSRKNTLLSLSKSPYHKHYDLSLLTARCYDLSQILLIVRDPACVFIFDQYSQRTEVWSRPPPSIIGISDFLIVLNARYKFKFPSILQFQIALYSIIQDGYWTNLILLVSLIVCSSSEFVELFKCRKKRRIWYW